MRRAEGVVHIKIAELCQRLGKFSNADRAGFLEIARGSALECAASVDVLAVRKLISVERVIPAKEQLVRIVNMLVGMLKRFSGHPGLLREEEGVYLSEQEQEQEENA